ncbi:MAG: branched-chain amino acid aminotransferase [Lentisphaerae bacterium]|jgi:branched-chain amino acid aminotransferase|nr:branched-chain amino acid aminotransferase [Lentisphaerota bacterium]MBT5610344.1 branched-chain amino acid aminotransferase [Lentisphaerota bacterium]MBT7056172.1 branched-chain amino acid aminotransferase [Lentisphaerota bacterium]MBT7841906.1 branched-chain amino acid aminotransferase [Lentisphaerota bacterium]
MDPNRLVFINGELVPEPEACISIFDVGFMYGVTLYESLRSFRHEWFLPDRHWRRLKRSLGYAGLTDALSEDEYRDALGKVLEANIELTDPADDIWVNIQVTPGCTFPMPLLGQQTSDPTVLCYTCALPHREYAPCYREGKHAVTSLFRTPPPQCYEQRMKNRSRFPHFLSKRDAQRIDPGAFGLMLDVDGFIAEGTGANIFFVLDGVLHTPKMRNILVGVSRQYVLGLAGELGVPVVESDLTLYDAYNAEEAFWTTSSYCILPVSMIDGRKIGMTYPGAMAQRLLSLWSEKVGVDIIGQAERFAGQE